ncbi:hypothetical protein [Corynebacterium aquilae]|uniref:Uncharacterized protein n=1 Tax=Corynebacterium aquilae DSM 44791 TaxID=1431546 RepID=A0A1L7CH49_9CORY|nr:hypothetical protein [Corynebacterium aquilae]APT85073.1 hypothetical protein CAQU_08320 [Corynebacterium aquilae DSM 44791]
MTDEKHSDEIQFIRDDYGLALFGHPATVDRFLKQEGLSAKAFDANTTRIAGQTLDLAAQAMEHSGRWVKLTKQSAADVKKYGMKEGVGVLRDAHGKFAKQLHFDPTAKISPAAVGGVGAVMAQLALEQAMAEVSEYLETIDQKLDHLLEDHKDQTVKDLAGVLDTIVEAEIIQRETGSVSETAWSKLSGNAQILGGVRGYSLRKIDSLTRELQRASSTNEFTKALGTLESELQHWLGYIANSLILNDRLSRLELERALGENIQEIEKYTNGVYAARKQRLEAIREHLNTLFAQLADASTKIAKLKLLHPRVAIKAHTSLLVSREQLLTFARFVELELESPNFEGIPGWFKAAGDAVQANAEKTKRMAKATTKAIGSSAEYVQDKSQEAATAGKRKMAQTLAVAAEKLDPDNKASKNQTDS